jgi:hypothetical protein
MDVGLSLVFVADVSKHMKTITTVSTPIGTKDITEWEDCFNLISEIYFEACMKNDELPGWQDADHISFDYNVGSLSGHKVRIEKDGKITTGFDINLKYGLKIGNSVFELKKIL